MLTKRVPSIPLTEKAMQKASKEILSRRGLQGGTKKRGSKMADREGGRTSDPNARSHNDAFRDQL
jgi:hypothetical protein